MKLFLHIGPENVGADRLQHMLAAKRENLIGKKILFPRSPGNKNHTRLFMSVTNPDHIDPLRFNRGFIGAEKQTGLRETLATELAAEIQKYAPETLILSASQLGASLHRSEELDRLYDLLSPFSDDIRIVAHVDEPARLLTRIYANQVFEGRATPLTRELALLDQSDWWLAATGSMPPLDPQAGQFEETQGVPFWLDYAALVTFWEKRFGVGSVTLRPYSEAVFCGESATEELRACFEIESSIGKIEKAKPTPVPSAAWLARGRQLNELLLQVLSTRKRILPRQLWRSFMGEMQIDGDPTDPGALFAVSEYFAQSNAKLAERFPALSDGVFAAPAPSDAWDEADPKNGFRASQYLLAFMYRIDRATRTEKRAKMAELARVNAARNAPNTQHSSGTAVSGNGLSDTAQALLPPLAVQKFEFLKTSSFKPHNRLGAVNEEELASAYTPAPPRKLAKGSTGNVIVGCMKNEAPYILEWVAYHRSIGVDNFLIYTNGCEDGTSEILDRLQELGILEHRNNDNWQGNSPQQYALDQSLNEPVIKNAEWIIHIDVDEFINVRCGNGTLDDFFDVVPDATNVAMTWRLFGHNGVTGLKDDFVVEQFDTCAPKFCPKPHTVWGFKTMFRNIGAYGKISCHRPNKLTEGFEDRVKWVNGSGVDMTEEAIKNGWRNSKKSIGYDLLQLNHYALRSAESFLIKRQRGRALHVDRSIGLNYWIRMDWSDFKDITIKRNVPRLRAEYDRLLQDDKLSSLHQSGLDWHRSKADELHRTPEFRELYEQALRVKLTETERVAYALALDLES